MMEKVGSHFAVKAKKEAVKLSPIEQIKKRAEDRQTPLYMGELMEILLVSGKSFDEIRLMTLEDFEHHVNALLE